MYRIEFRRAGVVIDWEEDTIPSIFVWDRDLPCHSWETIIGVEGEIEIAFGPN